MADLPPAPRPSAMGKRAEQMAERRDAWKSAQVLLHGGDWHEGVTPEDVLELAQWLAAGE